MRLRFILLLSLLPLCCIAQRPDTIRLEPPDANQEIIEDFLQNTDSEGVFDFNTLFEQLNDFRRNPIDLNKANEAILRDLGLLSAFQIRDFLAYRQIAGNLVSIYELQAIPSFDLETIRRILPFVTINSDLDTYQIPLSQMLFGGRNELYLRWSRILEQQKGFATSAENRYLGDPNQLYVRYRHAYGTRLSYGITAEKDRGEEFFTGSNRQGFDFYSAHFFIRDYNKTLKSLAVGDYTITLGQGLILYNGFGLGKSSAAILIKRTGRTVRPYTSANEVSFMRGVATTLNFGKNWEFTTFASARKRDANLIQPDTSEIDEEIRGFTSLDLDGLHRTPGEIADEKVLQQFTIGGSLKWKQAAGHIAINALYDQFDKKLERQLQPYNRFYFSGDRLFNLSADYSWLYRNFNFFGETALSDNGSIATLNGVLATLDRRVDIALLHRYYAKDYQALNANPFAETSDARNEQGLYLGAEIRPIKNWTISAYFDAWRHPWLRFNVDAPSRGWEYRARLTYELRRRLRIYLEVRQEVKERNASLENAKTAVLVEGNVFQTRLNIDHPISKSLELRTRMDVGFSEDGEGGKSEGFALYQDILFQPIDFPVSFTTRFAVFDTDGFQTRFYAYENDLLYNFSIPAYYNRGTRFYINLRYRPFRALTIEGRFSQTYWANQATIGSSLDEIQGQNRTQVSAQLRYQF